MNKNIKVQCSTCHYSVADSTGNYFTCYLNPPIASAKGGQFRPGVAGEAFCQHWEASHPRITTIWED